MQHLQIIKNSNDNLAYKTLKLWSLILMVLFMLGLLSWDFGQLALTWVMAILVLSVLILVLKLFYGFISPTQQELVIEDDLLRFGCVNRPNLQKVIPRDIVEGFIFDDGPDASICINTGKSICTILAPNILCTKDQVVTFVSIIQEKWTDIPVWNREQFQKKCSDQNT